MSFREHILYFVAAFNVPLGHAVRAHIVLHSAPVLCRNLALCHKTLTHGLGYFKGSALFKPFMNQVHHYVITRSYNLGNRAGAVINKVLCVAEPNVRTVGKTRNLQ